METFWLNINNTLEMYSIVILDTKIYCSQDLLEEISYLYYMNVIWDSYQSDEQNEYKERKGMSRETEYSSN